MNSQFQESAISEKSEQKTKYKQRKQKKKEVKKESSRWQRFKFTTGTGRSAAAGVRELEGAVSALVCGSTNLAEEKRAVDFGMYGFKEEVGPRGEK